MSNLLSSLDLVNPLTHFIEWLNSVFDFLFRFGNYILFLIFVIMGVVLLINAREKEYDEKIHGKIEYVKRRGRIGTALCIILAFGFLSGKLTSFLYFIFSLIPEPQFFINYIGIGFTSVESLEMANALAPHEKCLFLFINFLSFCSIILISIGIYLMCFNKFIIRSKLKFLSFVFVGVVYGLLFGFKTALRLLI